MSQRTIQFGIRAALGASPVAVVRLILKKGLMMVGLGIAVGLFGASMSSRLFQRLLYQIHPIDPVAYLCAAVFFGGVGLIACLVPAWRAARIDPMEAPRAE